MKAEKLWKKYHAQLQNQGLTARRIAKLKNMFKTVDRGLDGRFEEATRENLEEFVSRLHTGEFKQKNGTEYSGSSQSDIKKFLKQFYKWLEDAEGYPDRVRWIRTAIPKDKGPKQKRIVTLEEVSRLAQGFDRAEYRYMTLMLFDSGFRISELMSVRKRDLKWAEYDESGDMCWWIKCNESKTFTRSVPMPLFTEEFTAYTKTSAYLSQGEDDPLFPVSDRVFYNALRALSREVLGEPIAPHHLRHSSATHYAEALNGNVPMLAMRFGWSYNAQELQTYVRESGSYHKSAAKQIFSNELQQVKRENQAMRAEMEELKASLSEMSRAVRLLSK